MKSKPLVAVVFLVVVMAGLIVCWGGCGPTAKPEARVLLIGLDGIEMSVLKKLLAKDELPNIAGLIDRGMIGYLKTFEPTYSPVVWTSIATGKDPGQHKIKNFIDVNTGGPYTSNARRGKAVWNIVGDYDLKCNVTGYWITWPAEEINGTMISQVSTREQYDDIWKGMLYEGIEDATYPPEFIDELWPVVEPFQSDEFVTSEVLPEIFGDLSGLKPSSAMTKLISDSKWTFAGDYLYFEAGKYLLKNRPADLDIVYLGGTDVVGHRFWQFRQPELYQYKVLDKYIRSFADVIDNYYKLADRMVGELVATVPENTRVIICSDHGMHPDFLDGKDKGRRTLLSAHHLDAPPGFFVAAGEGIRKGAGLKDFMKSDSVEELGSVFDVAPTLLYLLDIPVGRDMRLGKVMNKVISPDLLAARKIEKVETHDMDFRLPTYSKSSQEGDQAFIDKFAELGYIDAGSPTSKSVPEFKMGSSGKKK